MKATEQRNTVLYTIIFIASICYSLFYFHFSIFPWVSRKSPIYDIAAFLILQMPKFSAAFVIASFALLFKRKAWTIVFSLLLDIWILAELVYFRVNGILLDEFSFSMAENMEGFWSSVRAFLFLSDIWLFAGTAVLLASFIYLRPKHRCIPGWLICLFIGILFCLGHYVSRILRGKNADSIIVLLDDSTWSSSFYASEVSVLHSFGNIIYKMLSSGNDVCQISDADRDDIFLCIGADSCETVTPDGNLVVILVESLESWAVCEEVTPNICRFFDRSEGCLIADKVIRQTRGGTSGDGQMIINTGLLPVREGAACMRFPGNTYPSTSSLFDSAAIVFPGDISVWNQGRMNDAYGIDITYSPEMDNRNVMRCDDSEIFTAMSRLAGQYPYVLALSVASHSPFDVWNEAAPITADSEMPVMMRNYLSCLHYTDLCLAPFFDMMENDPAFRNTTVVITGDHTIFDKDRRDEFGRYCESRSRSFRVNDEYCPLLIYSPRIGSSIRIEEECYQMDIYPTVMNLTGCGSYFWKGFGKNLPDSGSQRPFEEDRAFELSDLIIRSDFFREITKNGE